MIEDDTRRRSNTCATAVRRGTKSVTVATKRLPLAVTSLCLKSSARDEKGSGWQWTDSVYWCPLSLKAFLQQQDEDKKIELIHWFVYFRLPGLSCKVPESDWNGLFD